MKNKTIYQRKTKSDSLLGGWKLQTVTRKAHNETKKRTQVKSRANFTGLGIMAGVALGCLYLGNLYQPTINILYPSLAKAQEVSAVTPQLEQSEGSVAEPLKVEAGQADLSDSPEGWDEFVIAVEKVAPIYNFPKNVVLAQGALESARGTSTFAQERNNYLGIGAFDSNPDNAFSFENAEQCVIAYMVMLQRNFPDAWEQRENPEALLKALKVNSKGNYYASDPNYVNKVMSMNEWKQY